MSADHKRRKIEAENYTQGPLDEQFGQRRAFPLTESTEIGTDVLQYLRSVRSEAENDRPFYATERSTNADSSPPKPQSFILPQEDVDKVIEKLLLEKKSHEPAEEASETFIPISAVSTEETGEEALDIEQVEPEQDETQSQQSSIPQTASQWRNLVFTTEPDAEFLSLLEHTTIIKLIVYYTKWLLTLMPLNLSMWIFATFVRLDNSLNYAESTIVRDLGKKAKKIFTNVRTDENVLSAVKHTISMVLAVVGNYYGQRDLLEESDK